MWRQGKIEREGRGDNAQKIGILGGLSPKSTVDYYTCFYVIDLTNRFIIGVEALSLDAVFPWIFSAWPDGFNGRDEQVKQFV